MSVQLNNKNCHKPRFFKIKVKLIKVNQSLRPVDGGLFGVHWLRVAVVQAVGAVVIRHHGQFAQFHAVHNSRHVGAERGGGGER